MADTFDLYNQELNRLNQEIESNPLLKAVYDQARRDTSSVYRNNSVPQDIEAYERRNEINRNDPEFQNRVKAKLDQLIDKRLTDPNVIFAAISNDPDLDAAFPTHIDKFDALKQVQESVLDAQNELNALKGYNIEDKGFIRDTLGAVGSGLLNTAVSPYYAYKKHDIVNKLDNLPLNQLEGINKKLLTASQIQDKVDEAKERMYSNDLSTRTRALQELQYYKGTLDNLALTDEEQQIWDRYGKEYSSLKMELDQVNADKSDLLGSRNISTDEARVLMDQYRRREEYKRQGIDPSLGDHVFDAIKDATSSFGAVGRSLGNVLSSAIPFMIPVVGGALGVASFGSTAMEYATDLMEDHLRKYNELPTEEQLKAALYGALAAGIDYYGSKGLVKGYGGVAGQFFRGIGKTDAERFASEGAKFLAQKWESTLKGLPQGSIARATITDITDFVSKELPNLSKKEFDSVIKDLKGTLDKEIYKETLGTKAKKAIASLPEGIMRKTLEAPIKTVEAVGKVAKGVKTGNKYLHEHFDAGVQDMAKAGLGLASENVGSALVRQNYKGEYDKEEIARGLVDGFISGGAFHGISNAAYKPISGLKGVAKSTINKFMYGDVDLDNRTDFNTLTDKIRNADKDPNIAKYFSEITSAYSDKLDILNNTIEAARTENSNLLEKFGDVGLTINDEGKASVDEAKYSSSDANVSLKALKKAVSRYNRNQKIIDNAGAEVTLRKAEWDAAVKEGANKLLEKSKTSDEYTEEEKEKIKQSYVDTLNEDGQLKFLQKEEGMSEETAKRYLEAKKNKEAVPEDYTSDVADTGVSIHEVFERGNVDVFRFTDILEDPSIREAIANTDKVAFDNAIDKLVAENKADETKGISEQRANFVKEQFNEDKFNQFTRYETKGSKDGSFKELNKAVQDDVISSLNLGDKITLDDVKKDPSKLADYVKQQLTDRTSDKTIYQKAGEIKEDVKDIQNFNDIVDTTAGEVQTAIEKALKINEQLIGKKVYKKKEDAEKAIKDNKLSEAYTVNEVSEGRYVIAERDVKGLTDTLEALAAKKEPITEKEVIDFIDAYTKDLTIDETSIFKLKDKLRKTFNQYNSAPEGSKDTTKKALIEELNKLITGRKNTLNTAKEYVSNHEAVRSAIHGYDKNKDYIKESRARKAERALKTKADKALKEQTVTNSVFDSLTDAQAVTLAAEAINEMLTRVIAAKIDPDNPPQDPKVWQAIKAFTLKDIRNLKALNSRLLRIPDSVQEQEYIQTLLSIIDKTTVQTDNTVNTFVSPSIVMTGDVTGNRESVKNASKNNTLLREAFKGAFPNELFHIPMSIPELELASAINEAALDYDQQEQGRAAHTLNRNILNHRREIVDLLEQLQKFEITVENGGNSNLLELACSRAKIKVPKSFEQKDLTDTQLIGVFNAIFSCNECLRYLGLDPSVPNKTKINRENISKSMASKSITSYTELRNTKPNKGFNFTAKISANTDTFNSTNTLVDRIIALDKVFGGTGSIMYVLAQNSVNTDYPAIYKELLRTLEITQRADSDFYGLKPKEIDAIINELDKPKVLFASSKGVNSSEANWQMHNIQEFVQEAYKVASITAGNKHAQTAFSKNNVAFIKRLLLHKIATKLQKVSSSDKQNKFTDENYARLYRAYQICKGLPEYLPEKTKVAVGTIDNNTVSRLDELLWAVASTEKEFDAAINELRTAYKNKQTNIDADLTDTAIKEVRQAIYTVDGYLILSENIADKITDKKIKIALAKILQAKVNKNATTNNASSTTTGTDKLSNNGHNIAGVYVNHSVYADDVTVVGNRCAMLGNHANDYTIAANNPNYAGKDKLHETWKVITGIAKEGTRFLDSDLIIDKIFGMNVNGNLVYAEEILNVLAAVGLNNIMMIAKGQSEEFLQSLVANNVISSKAKAKMYREKFSDYESLCRSLGKQAIHSIGLRLASENSRANIEEQIAAELGARVLQLLEAKGYVSKQYVDNNGVFHSKKPEGSSIRVVKLTDGTNGLSNDGVDLNNRLETIEKYEYKDGNGLNRTGHVLEELLNGTNEKYPYRIDTSNGIDEFQDYQTKLENQFKNDEAIHRVTTHDVSYKTLDKSGNEVDAKFKVEIIPFTGLARVKQTNGTALNNGNPVYLNRKAVYKANGVMNEPLPLVELAFKSTERRTFNKQAYMYFIGNAMDDPKVKYWTDLPENVQRALGMDLDKLKGYPETYRIQKNEQIFRRAKEFHEYAKGLSDTEELVFPVVMTPNNRFLVDSPIFDYREFKPVRDLFTIVNSTVGRVSLKNPDGKVNEVKQTMAMATILFNYGVDVDKMTFEEIRSVFQKMYGTLKNMDLPNSSVSDITEKLKTIQFTVYKGVKDPEATLKTKLALPAQLLIHNLQQNGLQVMEDILSGNDLVNFHYMIEVDGLNNGSSHHFVQSDVFSNTDDISIAKAVAVGMIPKSLQQVNGTSFGNFISLMAHEPDKFRDVYMQSAETAKQYSVAAFIERCVSDVKASNTSINLLNDLCDIFNIDKKLSIEAKIAGLMSRDVMKKVAMPSTYGAGFDALLSHLAENITKELSKRLADVKDPTMDVQKLTRIYDNFRRYNKGDLVLLDKLGNTVMYSEVLKDPDKDLTDYLIFIEGNENLFENIKKTCLHDTVTGAKAVTVEASERGAVLNRAVEAQSKLFTAIVQKILKENYPDKSLGDITYKEQETILNAISTQFLFGTQKQSLDTLKPAVMAAIKLIDYNNKVTAHYRGGDTSVRFGSDIAKDSLGSAFSPIYIHGFDASNIAQAQQMIRQSLGAFTGIHDAVMINLRQFLGDGTSMSVPQAMNKSFINNALTAYLPLLEMSNNLQMGLDKIAEFMSPSDIAEIRRSMEALTGYACLEISNIMNLLEEARNAENGEGLIVNQFAFGDLTGFKITKKYAEEQIDKIKKSLSAKEMKKVETLSTAGFINWLKENNNTAYTALTKNKEYLFTLKSIKELQSAITDTNNPLGLKNTSITDTIYQSKSIQGLIDDYVKYRQGQYESSFFKIFTDAISEQAKARNDRVTDKLTKNAKTNKNAPEGIKELINILHIARDINSISKEGSITKLLNHKAHKLFGLNITNPDSYDILAMLVQMTTQNNISNRDLVKVKELAEEAKFLNGNLNIEPLNQNAESIIVEATDVNLSDTLDYITNSAIQEYGKNVKNGINESVAYTDFVMGYVNNLRDRLDKTKAKQIIFKMDSAIDFMLLPAVNQQIQLHKNNSSSPWHGCTIAIAPNATDRIPSNMNKNLTHAYYLKSHLTKEIHQFTVINPTENRDNELLNLEYDGRFTHSGSLTGQRYDNQQYTVSIDETNGREIKSYSFNRDLADRKPDIYIANYYGKILTCNESGLVTPNMMRTQKSPSDISGIAEYQNNVINFSEKNLIQDGDVDREWELPSLNIVNATPHFTSGSHIVVGINSDGTVINKKIYNSTISRIPALKEAHKEAMTAYKDMEKKYANDPNMNMDVIHMPITIETYLDNFTPIKVTFIISKDNQILLSDILEFTEPTSSTSGRAANYVLKTEASYNANTEEGRRAIQRLQEFRDRFSDTILRNANNDRNNAFSSWIYHIRTENAKKTPDEISTTRITIPENIINEDNYVYDYNSTLASINIDKVCNISLEDNVIYLGTDANPANYYYKGKGKKPTIYSYDNVKGYEAQKTIGNRIASAISSATYNTIQNTINAIRRHGYTTQKSDEDMNVYDTAVYRDLTCKDSQDLFDSLVSEDRARSIETSHLDPVFNMLKSLHIDVRYYLNNLAYSQGSAFIETINAKPTGYINFNTKGTGSHAEVFVHEYSHIPLEYLKYDANAYRLATQLYQFAAKNLTLEDFDCSREEAERIYNYIFRDTNTVDPQIEFITYSLTNADFRKALDKMAERAKFKKEFNDKKESVLARFVNTISGSLNNKPSNNINSMIFDIFKRSVDLCNEYGKKAPRDEDAYLAEKMQLSKADLKIQNAITFGLSKISSKITDAISSIAETTFGRVRAEEKLRLAETNQDSKIANQMKDILPAMMDALPPASEGFQDIANQLRQSFEGVSDGNYEYVKLRYQAKETIDKARENASSALNEVIRKATKDIPQKTLNEMSEYVLRADMSCLVDINGYSKQELSKLLTDKAYRKEEINRIENNLRHGTYGNFYVNASKGLIDKLITGINTSGIGYNNAYEIANFSGSKLASNHTNMVPEIDRYITLSVMDKLDSKNGNVYRNLNKHLDVLMEILNIHNGLKKMEYSQVYGESMQKVHIPKGELHGGKIPNKFTVVPKSQLKAYKWAGYKDEGKVKFDPFYNHVIGEEYYKVSAKHMPNVPYVDGIPVLTDIFNGRNKSDVYLGGKKVESTQISPTFQKQEFQAVSDYINRRIQELNSPNYKPLDSKSIDGVITPTFGIGNKLTGCDFQLNQKESDKYLNRHIKFTSALGDHYGSIIERMKAPDWNIQVSQALDDLYKERHDKHDFTWLKQDTDNAEYLEIYNLLPYEMKKFFKDKYGVDGVPVETRYLTGIVGYREISANKIDKNDLEWNNKLKHSVTEYLSHIFHNGYVAKGETFLRYLTKLGKENLVIKGVAVSVDNILSNNVTLSVLGLSPEQVCKYQIEGLNNLLKYKEMSRERYMLKTKEITNTLTEADRARIRGLEASMKALPISYLAEHGAMPTIAEDLTESDRLAKDFIDRNLPKELQTFAHNAIGDQKSWAYRHLSDLATFGDITARYAQFKYLTEDKHINKEEAFRQCMQTFIDYSNPLPRNLQYFDSIGALPFTKFLLGNQTNVLNSLVKKPSRALAGIMATSAMGVPSIYDSILGLDAITNRWKVPGFGLWYDSLGTLPINRALDIL